MGDSGSVQGITDGIDFLNKWVGHFAPFGFIPDTARRKAQGETISNGEILENFGKSLATQSLGMLNTLETVSATGYTIGTGPLDFPGDGSGGGDGSDGSDGSGEGDEGDTGGSDGDFEVSRLSLPNQCQPPFGGNARVYVLRKSR